MSYTAGPVPHILLALGNRIGPFLDPWPEDLASAVIDERATVVPVCAWMMIFLPQLDNIPVSKSPKNGPPPEYSPIDDHYRVDDFLIASIYGL